MRDPFEFDELVDELVGTSTSTSKLLPSKVKTVCARHVYHCFHFHHSNTFVVARCHTVCLEEKVWRQHKLSCHAILRPTGAILGASEEHYSNVRAFKTGKHSETR